MTLHDYLECVSYQIWIECYKAGRLQKKYNFDPQQMFFRQIFPQKLKTTFQFFNHFFDQSVIVFSNFCQTGNFFQKICFYQKILLLEENMGLMNHSQHFTWIWTHLDLLLFLKKIGFLKKVTCSSISGSRKFCCLAVNFLGYSFYSGSHDGIQGFLKRVRLFFLELRFLTFLNLTKKYCCLSPLLVTVLLQSVQFQGLATTE